MPISIPSSTTRYLLIPNLITIKIHHILLRTTNLFLPDDIRLRHDSKTSIWMSLSCKQIKPEKHGGYNIDINGVVKTIIIRAWLQWKTAYINVEKCIKNSLPLKQSRKVGNRIGVYAWKMKRKIHLEFKFEQGNEDRIFMERGFIYW